VCIPGDLAAFIRTGFVLLHLNIFIGFRHDVNRKDTYFVIVKTPAGTIEPKSVSIGSNNDKFAVITMGLSAGEEILVDADTYRDAIEFPTVP